MPISFLVWGVVALVGIVALAFGLLTLGTNLFVAVGIGLIAVGAARLFRPGNPTIGFALVFGGVLLWLGHEYLPDLTVGEVAAMMGGA